MTEAEAEAISYVVHLKAVNVGLRASLEHIEILNETIEQLEKQVKELSSSPTQYVTILQKENARLTAQLTAYQDSYKLLKLATDTALESAQLFREENARLRDAIKRARPYLEMLSKGTAHDPRDRICPCCLLNQTREFIETALARQVSPQTGCGEGGKGANVGTETSDRGTTPGPSSDILDPKNHSLPVQKAVDHAEGITTLYKKFNEKIYIVGQWKHTCGDSDNE